MHHNSSSIEHLTSTTIHPSKCHLNPRTRTRNKILEWTLGMLELSSLTTLSLRREGWASWDAHFQDGVGQGTGLIMVTPVSELDFKSLLCWLGLFYSEVLDHFITSHSEWISILLSLLISSHLLNILGTDTSIKNQISKHWSPYFYQCCWCPYINYLKINMKLNQGYEDRCNDSF